MVDAADDDTCPLPDFVHRNPFGTPRVSRKKEMAGRLSSISMEGIDSTNLNILWRENH
jgi:hypothetical protein